MNNQNVDSDTQNPRKRKRIRKGIDPKKHDVLSDDLVGIDNLSDDLLIAILSRMSLKEAMRTSILSSRWKNLWKFTSGTLKFDDKETSTGTIMKRKRFKAWVNHVLNLHHFHGIDSLVIRFTNLRLRARSSDIDSWIRCAMAKQVKRFELDLSDQDGFHCCYKFPSINMMLFHALELKVKSGFGSLRVLRLVDVDIDDEVVQYILASCPFVEQLCIKASSATKNLEIADPLPNLKELEVSDCSNLESMDISAMNLVSCTYLGRNIGPPFKKTPNLSELTLGGLFCKSFILEAGEHSTYSAQLVKLVLNLEMGRTRKRSIASPDLHQLYSLKQLEVNTVAWATKSLLFFISLIKAYPNLQEFKIKIDYPKVDPLATELPYPIVSSPKVGRFGLEKLKVFEMVGFNGLPHEKELLLELAKIAPKLEMVFIDTQSDFCRNHPLSPSMIEKLRLHSPEIMKRVRRAAKIEAVDFKSKLPSVQKFIVNIVFRCCPELV